VRDEQSENAINATARGALNGGRIAVIVGCLLIAFIPDRPCQRAAQRDGWFD
jgi:nucleoside permease NupC